MAGVLSAKQCFTETEIVTRATAIYEAAEWDWFQDTDGSHCPIGQMHAGWRPPTTTVETDGLFGCWGGYNEGMILYLLAIGSPTHPVSPTAWISWANTYKEHWGAFYGYPVLACPALFTHQYSHCWIDFRNKRDNYTNYFRNSVYASLANRAYSNDVWYPDVDLWGSTASYGPLTATCRVTTTCPPREGTWAAWRPWVEPGTCDENAPCTSAVTSTCAAGVDKGTAYHSYGYPPEVEWNDGTIAPTAAGGSIVFTPDYSISTLRHMYEKYFRKLWGFQGLKDSLNIRSEPDWFANDYVGIDVGAMLLMIENYGTGFVWDIFMRNQEVGGAMRAVGFVTDTTKIPSWFYYREAEECNLASGVGISVEVHTMAWNAKTLQIDRDAEPNPGNFALYTITVDYEENSSMFFAIRYSDDVAGDVIDVYLDGVKKGSFTTDKFASDGWEAFGWDSERINMGVVAPGIHTIKLEVAAENAGEYGLLYGVNLDVFQLYTSLEVSKQATPNPVRPGAPLIYTLSVTNTSGITLTATITDILPDYVTPTSVHTWTPPPIAPDGVWTEQVTATVQMGYCGPLTNEVQIATEERATGSAITVVDVFCFRVYLPLMLRRFP